MSLGVRDAGGGIIVVALGPQVTLDLSDDVKEAVCKAIAERCKAIVFDMSGVEFIDSQGLELLLWVRDYCQLSLVGFRLAGLGQLCQKILQITRLADEFSCRPDLASAVRSFA